MRWTSHDPCIWRNWRWSLPIVFWRPGGDLLVKLFQGAGFEQIIRDARRRYGRVVTKKPKASRTRSPEIYLLARQFGMV